MSRLHPIAGCDDGARRADVVFVHGLGGDPFGTWRHGEDQSTSWPHWVGREFSDVGVWSLGYAASPTKWARFKSLFIEGASDAPAYKKSEDFDLPKVAEPQRGGGRF